MHRSLSIFLAALSMSYTAMMNYTEAKPISEEPHQIIYQIYVESFFDGALKDGSGDFSGVEAKLDYLSHTLGVTALLLMPIFDGWGMGYIANDLHLLRADYGGSSQPLERERAFQNLVSAAHSRGMKILVDMPLNHISTDSNWFRLSESRAPGYEDYFLWSDRPKLGWRIPWEINSGPASVWHWNPVRHQYYYGLFSSSMPDLNHTHPSVQKETLSIFKKLSAWGVDGYRIDAAKHFVEGNDNLNPLEPANLAILEYYLKTLRSEFPGKSFLLEAWSNQHSQFEPFLPNSGDVVFDFAYMETLRDSLVHRHPWAVRKSIKHLEEVQGRYLPGNRVIFSGNHDVPRLRTLLKNNRPQVELAQALTLSLPFTSMIYYGEEIFMSGDYIRSNQPGKTRNEVCTPMAWTPHINAGFTDPTVVLGNTWNKKLHSDWQNYNVESQLNDAGSFLNFIREMIQIRKSLKLDNQTRIFVDERDPSDPVLRLAMTFSDHKCVIGLFNFTEQQAQRDWKSIIPDVCKSQNVSPLFNRRSTLLSSQTQVQLDSFGFWIGTVN
jgi:alpha-amylase